MCVHNYAFKPSAGELLQFGCLLLAGGGVAQALVRGESSEGSSS